MVKTKRSKKLRKIYVRVPSSKSRIIYKKRKPKIAKCAICKKQLQGIPRKRPSKLKNISKSQKTPKRIFGGYLCIHCTKREIIKRART
ncbi:MAG: 50S ribosomal protein L34e [Nanoarchaeota archaeon]|nr:50S ribosomal protein L34e [Nanoarchaeota archaeon]